MPALAALASCDDTVYALAPQQYEANWLGVEAFLWNECRSCHIDGGPGYRDGAGVILPDYVVTDPGFEVGGSDTPLVVPFDPEGSALWQVISPGYQRANVAESSAMPLDSGTLPLQTTQHVFDWIEAGADLDD